MNNNYCLHQHDHKYDVKRINKIKKSETGKQCCHIDYVEDIMICIFKLLNTNWGKVGPYRASPAQHSSTAYHLKWLRSDLHKNVVICI